MPLWSSQNCFFDSALSCRLDCLCWLRCEACQAALRLS
jgi:hypothetical protein